MNTLTAGTAVVVFGTMMASVPSWAWFILVCVAMVAVAALVTLRNTKRRAEQSMEAMRREMERRHREEMDALMKTMVSRMESAIARRSESAVAETERAAHAEADGTREESEAEVPQAVDDSNAAVATAQWDEQEMEVRTDGHRFTMLMVDDNADMCRFVHDYFRGVYKVFTARNGVQALEVLAEQDNIDLVVSDVTMPQMDGMELCRRIKADLRWSHIPVVLLTGLTDQQKETEGLKLGADDYITKPFNAETLRLRVKSLIEKKERRQQQFREQVDVEAKDITITSVDEEFIQSAMRICEEHIADTDFSVEALGHELNLSRTYLYKKLVNITGKSPNEFIRTIRMKRGKQMLEQDTMQIAEISAALGYSSPKRFTENFKVEYGKSPSEYLREVRSRKQA